jgi:thiol-disulfide isomerase/thioredoxin
VRGRARRHRGRHADLREDLEKHVKPKLIEIDNQRYEALSEGLDEMISEQLMEKEAKSRNVTTEQLVATEITAKIPDPSDAEIQKVYDANKAQLQGQTLDQVKPRIVAFLKQQGGAARQQAFIEELQKVSHHRRAQAAGGERRDRRSTRDGRRERPRHDHRVLRLRCPYCKRAHTVVDEVMKNYDGKVNLVYRDYPLPFHEHARPAAEAANCANAQGKFWPYHQKLWAASDLSTDKLKAMAGELGLDQQKFDDCLAKAQFKADIDKDIADGSAVGVTGTPAFFINGRMLSGAQPFEKFKEVIDQELARSSKS